MAESVKVLPQDIQEIIEVHEWDMRTREGVQRFRELKYSHAGRTHRRNSQTV
jgi:hypothetical protein